MKLSGTYLVEEDGTIQGMNLDTKSYTDKLDISVSGITPTGGYLNYENNVLKDGCLTMDEYKVIIESGEVTVAEKGTCESISLTACNSVNFNPSPENWFNFNSSTGIITGFSNAWDGTTDITIPCQIGGVDVVNIGSGAFVGKGLTSVVLNDNIVHIQDGAFYDNDIINVALGNNVKIIGSSIFSRNEIEIIIIPNSVETIGAVSFNENNLIKLIIGNKVSSIGDSAFYGNELKNLVIPGNVTMIGNQAFRDNLLINVDINEGVQIIGGASFYNNQLTTITIPNSVTEIRSEAFNYNKLEKITIPSNVTTIGNYAFEKTASSNPNLTIIYNNTGESFDWGMIVNRSTIETEYNFEIGTVINEFGNVEIKKSN